MIPQTELNKMIFYILLIVTELCFSRIYWIFIIFRKNPDYKYDPVMRVGIVANGRLMSLINSNRKRAWSVCPIHGRDNAITSTWDAFALWWYFRNIVVCLPVLNQALQQILQWKRTLYSDIKPIHGLPINVALLLYAFSPSELWNSLRKLKLKLGVLIEWNEIIL